MHGVREAALMYHAVMRYLNECDTDLRCFRYQLDSFESTARAASACHDIAKIK